VTRRDVAAIAIVVAVVTLIFSDVLFFGRAFYFRDVTRFYYPMKKVTRDIILSGEFPSWNPYLSEGQPLAANPEFAVFYPPNWLLLLPDFEFAFRLHVLLHYYLAAIGVYVLLRSRRLRIESAIFGAFAYALGGLMLSLSCLIPYLFCLAWLPWLAFFLGRTSRRDAALAAISLAMILLGGEPVTIAQIILMAAVYAVWLRRRPAMLWMIFAAALLIASVQIIPAIDHVRDSVRSRPFPFSLVATWSTPPVKAFEVFVPGVLGFTGDHAAFYWGTAAYHWLDPFFLSIYPGLLAASLALAALLLRRPGWIAVALALAGGFILAIGSHTPLIRILYEARLFSSFRYPEKFLILAIVPLTIFAAFAFDRLIGGDDRIARVAVIVAAATGALCAVFIILALTPSYADAFIRFWSIEVHPFRRAMAALSMRTWLFGFVRAVCVVGLLLMRRRMRPEIWSRLAVALLVIDLGIERPFVAETVPSEFFAQRPKTIPQLRNDVRLFHQADWYGATAIFRSYFDLPEMYWVIRNGAYPHVNAQWGIESAMNRDIDQTALLPTADFLAAIPEVRDRTQDWLGRLAAMTNAGYRAIFLPTSQAGRGPSIRPIVFLPVPTNPRFYFADRVVPCNSRSEFVSAIANLEWSRRSACAAVAPFAPARGEVLQLRKGSNFAALRVRSDGDALLICSITRHKYWRASIDGKPTALVPANLAYQAIRVPPGDHDVELRYDNPLVRWFGIVSLIALIAAVILAMIPERDRAQL
jgi:hypothetical protein